MTFNGSWHKLRTDPAAKFMVLSLVFYAASTFEGPMMAIKTVNSLSHYTDWTIAHVHSGALGWVAMITIGSLYSMAPRALGQQEMYSHKRDRLHFWMHTIGVLLYIGVDVDRRRHPGPDVARDQCRRHADLRLHRQPDRDLAVVPRSAGSAACSCCPAWCVMAWNLWHTAAERGAADQADPGADSRTGTASGACAAAGGRLRNA